MEVEDRKRLSKANDYLNQWDWSNKTEILEAMQVYAKQVAIDFLMLYQGYDLETATEVFRVWEKESL